MVLFTTFVNCRLCINGELVEDKQIVTSEETGTILPRTGYIGGDIVDVDDNIIAPGFLDLHTNGMLGFHFTQFENEKQLGNQLAKVAKCLPSKGVTGFWATIPTVERSLYKKVLPLLRPRTFEDSASLLGTHVEGPYLHPSKKGAHNSKLFAMPQDSSPGSIYGQENLGTSVKLVTLASELPGSAQAISSLVKARVAVSLGYSTSDYDGGLSALSHGATALTHVFNAMTPLHDRDPGLEGLISSKAAPYYSLIADGVHLHPSTLTIAYRANPKKAILVTDPAKLAGLPGGLHPGYAQVQEDQIREGHRITVGGSNSLDECVRNLVQWSGCTLAEAVRCVTENIADMMGLANRGRLVEGMKADFVVLNDNGEVLQTWVGGKKVWEL